MSYKPMTADEAAKLNIKAEGVYAFDVLEATPAISKAAQNPMIALVLSFYDTDGDRFTVKDWLVHSDSRWAEKKFYDFANTTGLSAQYQSGALEAEQCLGRSGFAFLGVEKGKPKDGGGNFPDRNNVKYYTAASPTAQSRPGPSDAQLANTAAKPAADEDVPF